MSRLSTLTLLALVQLATGFAVMGAARPQMATRMTGTQMLITPAEASDLAPTLLLAKEGADAILDDLFSSIFIPLTLGSAVLIGAIIAGKDPFGDQ